MRDSFGIVQLSGMPGEKWKHSKASMRELEARRQWESLFPFVSQGVMIGGLAWSSTIAHRWIWCLS